MKKLILPLALCIAISGCSNAPLNSTSTIEREGQSPIEQVASDDKRMNAAIQKARKTVPVFVRALQSPKANQSAFAIKARFSQDDKTEHMWLNEVSFKKGLFTRIVGNEPNNLTNVKLGDKVTLKQGEISDWMYVEDKKLVGGYTIGVLRDPLSPDEKKEFDKSLPFTAQ